MKTKTYNGRSVALMPYHRFSNGAKVISRALNIQREPQSHVEIVLNWGRGSASDYGPTLCYINHPSAVQQCGNKLTFFKTVGDTARTPEFTDNRETALEWAQSKEVLGRSRRGSCGQDIAFLSEDPEKWNSSEFWTAYKKKKSEFRVHFWKSNEGTKVHLVQQKVARQTDPETGAPIDTTSLDYRIRNHANGFIFKRNDVKVPEDVLKQSVLAAEAIKGLDFGAVDVIYNQYEDKAYVLEINTAPGLEESTIADYAKMLEQLILEKAA